MCILPGSDYGFVNLYKFDVLLGVWTDLTNLVYGIRPSPRHVHGIAAVNYQAYVFGGVAEEQGWFAFVVKIP
jgi:hypothetical protein